MKDIELIREIETIFRSAAIMIPFLEKQEYAWWLVARQISRVFKVYIQSRMRTTYYSALSESLDSVQSVIDTIEMKSEATMPKDSRQDSAEATGRNVEGCGISWMSGKGDRGTEIISEGRE